MRLPDLAFSEYFHDHNHQHNVDDADVLGAIIGRRILISAEYRRDGKRRRSILCKGDAGYLTVVCEPADTFWWVLSAYPSRKSDAKRAKAERIGEDHDETTEEAREDER